MKFTKLIGAFVVTLSFCTPAWAGESDAFAKLPAWTKHATGAPCDEECPECASDHVCDRDDAGKVNELICKLNTAHKAGRRERAAAKLEDYDCCCYPEIVPALIAALSDPEEDVREEAAESLGELRCCTPEALAALESLLCDPERGVRREARKALKRCGVQVMKIKTCGHCGGCSHCGTCGCGAEHAHEAVFDTPAPNISYDAFAPAPGPATEPES